MAGGRCRQIGCEFRLHGCVDIRERKRRRRRRKKKRKRKRKRRRRAKARRKVRSGVRE